jgi:hypothetical protein
MDEIRFCEKMAAAGTATGSLAAILILGLFALWFAAHCRERVESGSACAGHGRP